MLGAVALDLVFLRGLKGEALAVCLGPGTAKMSPFPTQVVEKFVDLVEPEEQEHGPEAASAERDARAKRQVNWLKRGISDVGGAASWRPRKRYQVAARRWLLLLDNSARDAGSESDLI